jgi:hypothetical protein
MLLPVSFYFLPPKKALARAKKFRNIAARSSAGSGAGRLVAMIMFVLPVTASRTIPGWGAAHTIIHNINKNNI